MLDETKKKSKKNRINIFTFKICYYLCTRNDKGVALIEK